MNRPEVSGSGLPGCARRLPGTTIIRNPGVTACDGSNKSGNSLQPGPEMRPLDIHHLRGDTMIPLIFLRDLRRMSQQDQLRPDAVAQTPAALSCSTDTGQ